MQSIQRIKKSSDTLDGIHATMTCNSNAAAGAAAAADAAAIGSWLSSKTMNYL